MPSVRDTGACQRHKRDSQNARPSYRLFRHAGDGNIHVNIMYDGKDAKEAEAAHETVGDVFKLTLGLGGTISGEHGVGITSAPYIGMELGADVIALMKRIKTSFDPNGILNPGKVFAGG